MKVEGGDHLKDVQQTIDGCFIRSKVSNYRNCIKHICSAKSNINIYFFQLVGLYYFFPRGFFPLYVVMICMSYLRHDICVFFPAKCDNTFSPQLVCLVGLRGTGHLQHPVVVFAAVAADCSSAVFITSSSIRSTCFFFLLLPSFLPLSAAAVLFFIFPPFLSLSSYRHQLNLLLTM